MLEVLNLFDYFVGTLLYVFAQFLEKQACVSRFDVRETANPVVLHSDDTEHDVFHIAQIVFFVVLRHCDTFSQ